MLVKTGGSYGPEIPVTYPWFKMAIEWSGSRLYLIKLENASNETEEEEEEEGEISLT